MAIDNVARALALQGVPGVGIASITFDSDVPQGKRYKINLDDGTYYYFVAPKGSKVEVAATGTSTTEVRYITIDDVEYKLPPVVNVSDTGTATDEVKYITCQNVEKKLYAGVDYDSTDTQYPTKIKYVASLPESPDPHTLYIIPE